MRSFHSHSFQKSKADALYFLLILFAVIAIWMTWGHFSFQELIGQDDARNFYWPIGFEFQKVHGAWWKVGYRANILGGTVLYPHFGFPFVSNILLALGAAPHTALNFMIFFSQAGFGFFVTQGTQLVKKNNDLKCLTFSNIYSRLLWSLLFAFSPFMAWRIFHGHYNLIAGIVATAAFLYIWLSSTRNESTSGFAYLLTIMVFLNALGTSSMQIIYYAFILFPILLAFSPGQDFKLLQVSLKRVIPFLLISFLISLPLFSPLFFHHIGSQSGRLQSGAMGIYSYWTAHWQEWLASLFYNSKAIPSLTHSPFWHEAHYAIGPLFILGMLAFSKNKRSLITATTTLALVLAISTHVPLISELILNFFPLLKSFRVPARLIYPLIVIFYVYAPTLHIKTQDFFSPISSPLISNLILLTIALSGYFLSLNQLKDLYWLDVILWIIIFIALAIRPSLIKLSTTLPFMFLLIHLVFFFEKALPQENAILLTDNIKNNTSQLKSNSPLDRIISNRPLPGVYPNDAFIGEFSTIMGYGHPSPDFRDLYEATYQLPPDSVRMTFLFDRQIPNLKIWQQLFNLQFLNRMTESRPVLFPTHVFSFKNKFELRHKVLAFQANLADFMFVTDDVKIEIPLEKCSSVKIADIIFKNNVQDFDIILQKFFPGCPLVVTINYNPYFEVLQYENETSSGIPVKTFLANGTQLGLIPQGSGKILKFHFKSRPGVIEWFFCGLGVLLLVFYRRIFKFK